MPDGTDQEDAETGENKMESETGMKRKDFMRKY